MEVEILPTPLRFKTLTRIQPLWAITCTGDAPKSERELMREILVGAIVLGSLLSSHLPAAQRSSFVRSGAAVNFRGSTIVPPLHNVVPPLGSFNTGIPGNIFNGSRNGFRGGRQNGNQFGVPFWDIGGFWGDFYGGDYAGYPGDYVGGYQAQAQPSVVVLMPQMAMPPPPMPSPPPARPEIREYNWPASSSSSTPEAFSIVTKDHRVESAIAVWAQDGALVYVTPDGTNKRIPISSVDREATRQRNAEKHLTLSIP